MPERFKGDIYKIPEYWVYARFEKGTRDSNSLTQVFHIFVFWNMEPYEIIFCVQIFLFGLASGIYIIAFCRYIKDEKDNIGPLIIVSQFVCFVATLLNLVSFGTV